MMAQGLDISDDVHGRVRLSEHERRVVDSPWFQRLRHIHQLGLAHMVFPGAEQTRFGHSLGVLHLAGRLAEKLRSHLQGDEARELRAAALLHDVGHFPFSHTLEKLYRDAALGEAPELTQAKGESEGPVPGLSGTSDDTGPQFHEEFGRGLIERTDVDRGIARILREGELEPSRVASIVVGAHPNVLLNQVVNSDLDVDQLDYLLRDAKATGSAYGQYDLEYLLECMDVAYVERKPMLCVRMNGLHPVEHYVLAKYFYYMCILHQKTRCAAEGMLQEIARELIKAKKLPTWNTLAEGAGDPWFCRFDDAFVWEQVREAAGDNEVDESVRQAADMLVSRRLPKVTREAHRTVGPGAGLPEDAEYGTTGDPEWNEVVRRGVEDQSHQKFTVLKKRVQDGSPESLKELLFTDPGPIRMLVHDPYVVPGDTPRVDATDKDGTLLGSIVLLESLKDSVVAALAGRTTHIARVYRPPERD